jgi:cellulose synthase/poly-beta-1,6-N-acetylglucosamine synthase-like glycosyltransferase
LTYLTSYNYDVQDNVLSAETKDIVNSKITYILIYTYDEKNNLLTSSIKGNGSYDYDEVYTYDGHGNKWSYSKVLKEGENITKTEVLYTYVDTAKWVSHNFYEEL